MIPKVVSATHAGDYVIQLRFADGTEGKVDLASDLHGPLFEPLKDLTLFRQFQVHPDFHTLYWPNGADVAPEYLHEKTRAGAEDCSRGAT
jgi:hypothetical protein